MSQGYDEWRWGRVLTRTISQVDEEHYEVKLEISFDALTPAQVCAGSGLALTPAGTYAPLNSETTPDGNIAYYFRAGMTFPEVPSTPYSGDWHFQGLGSSGSPDRPVSASLGNTVRIIVVGPGILTVNTADPSSGVTGDWNLYHRHAGDADPTLDDSEEGFTIGDPQVIVVSTHGGTECVHWVDFSSNGPGGADGYGYAGCTWLPIE